MPTHSNTRSMLTNAKQCFGHFNGLIGSQELKLEESCFHLAPEVLKWCFWNENMVKNVWNENMSKKVKFKLLGISAGPIRIQPAFYLFSNLVLNCTSDCSPTKPPGFIAAAHTTGSLLRWSLPSGKSFLPPLLAPHAPNLLVCNSEGSLHILPPLQSPESHQLTCPWHPACTQSEVLYSVSVRLYSTTITVVEINERAY